jgi:7,8-dihydropterin-6-yl-methyl-4-(beta-D-ribofuranosyl)aminobenzene 5'-phosphate synthase
MRIVTLIENLVYNQGLVAEHGLSLYIETGKEKILFDTGQTGLFIQNAQKLGIDIADVDSLVLSHGHYDHTGGLYPFLEKNSKAKVYAKRNIFIPKYSGKTRFIGTMYNEEPLKNRLVYIDFIEEIAENVFIMPNINIHNPIDTNFKGMNRKIGNEIIPDEFDDEQFLLIKQPEKINILSACSHSGITNICTTATEYFNSPIGLILGGFHMKDCSCEQYVEIISCFRQLQPQSIGVCHCTGIEKFADLHHECEVHSFYNYIGNEITIN